jgi:hypothetical protein
MTATLTVSQSLAPIHRAVSVSWSPDAAFKRFTADFATWWPRKTHSIGGPRVSAIVFEQRVGGRIYEEHVDGRRFQWGEILAWDPPRSVRFTFHASRDPSTAQEVELRFVPEGSGTRLELTASKWENWGRNARRARRGYEIGWGYVLNVWADRRTAGMLLLDGLGAVLGRIELLRHGGRGGLIDSARGEIARAVR